MKKYLTVLLSLFVLIALVSMVYAAKDKEVSAVSEKAKVETTAKNMTYGQCVSQQAEVKNSCYATVKEALKTCNDQAAQSTTKKDATKQCKQTYKKDLTQCKSVFKDGKKECKKIKHNFFETLGSAFK